MCPRSTAERTPQPPFERSNRNCGSRVEVGVGLSRMDRARSKTRMSRRALNGAVTPGLETGASYDKHWFRTPSNNRQDGWCLGVGSGAASTSWMAFPSFWTMSRRSSISVDKGCAGATVVAYCPSAAEPRTGRPWEWRVAWQAKSADVV